MSTTHSWTIAGLRSDMQQRAAELAQLIDADNSEGLNDADMRARYREGVDAVRRALVEVK